MINIDKDIPLPGLHEEIKQAISKLKPGDSFLLPGLTVSGRTGLYRLAKQFRTTLITRSVKGGVRVWRLK